MKISLDWLGDFVEWNTSDLEEIGAKVTTHIAEVDEVEIQGKPMQKCCVGQVTNLRKHPDADKLSLCDVVTDDGAKQIVCGGTNLRNGMRVAFAHVGATVSAPDGSEFTLSKAKIRGETSEGMICAAGELLLEERFPTTPEQGSRPIIDLGDGNEDVGKDLREFLGLTDTILHIDNHAITHRPDLFSHVGFARECVAIGIAKWKKQPEYNAPKFPEENLPFKNLNDIEELVPRYCACMLEVESIGETPDWMKKRLEATGWRSVSLPVDITNYVTMELGMPLHSFDADDLKGDIRVRLSQKGEKIVTLDGEERELPEGAIVLSDDKGIFDLLGIMGGLRSSTKDSTTKIYLHSAILDPVSIRRTIIATGHRTDASTVYEKSVPRVSCEQGFFLALKLMLELIPGAKLISAMDTWGDSGKAEPIALSVEHCNRLLGTKLSSADVSKILTNLGFTVEGKDDSLSVTPPLWRLKDSKSAIDLIEDVGRIYGFDAIEPKMPSATAIPPARNHSVHQIRSSLKEQGFYELIPLSLISPDLIAKCKFAIADAEEIENPLGEEVGYMQPSVLPRLLEHAAENLRYAEQSLQTFHTGHVFSLSKGEHTEMGILVTNKSDMGIKQEPFLVAKAAIMESCNGAGFTLLCKPTKTIPPYAHSGRCVDLLCGDTVIGTLFEVHPAVAGQFGLEQRAAAVLMNADALFAMQPAVTVAAPLPQFPEICYDVTVEMDHGKSAKELLEEAKKQSELMESIEVADLYADPKKGGTYNVTVHITYRSNEKTLTEEEAKKEHDKVLRVLQ